MIISKSTLEKEGQLIIRDTNKTALVEVGRTLSPIDLNGKYMWVISNVDIDTA